MWSAPFLLPRACYSHLLSKGSAMHELPPGAPATLGEAFGLINSTTHPDLTVLKVMVLVEAAGKRLYEDMADQVADPAVKALVGAATGPGGRVVCRTLKANRNALRYRPRLSASAAEIRKVVIELSNCYPTKGLAFFWKAISMMRIRTAW